MLIVSALREIGEGKATPEQLEIIKSHFSKIQLSQVVYLVDLLFNFRKLLDLLNMTILQ
jgi:hypothetical protein